jgi:hypothetical protein
MTLPTHRFIGISCRNASRNKGKLAGGLSLRGLGPLTVAVSIHVPEPYMQHTSGIRAEDRIAFDHPELSRRSQAGRGPADGDAPDEPRVHLAVHSSHGTNPDLDTPRKPKICLQLIDH